MDLTATELAARTGVTPADVERLTALGILTPQPGAKGFRAGDVFRVRLVAACEGSGLPAERIAEAIEAGRLSLSFVDAQFDHAPVMTGLTFAELYARHGVPGAHAASAFEAAGFAAPDPQAPANEDDAAIVAGVAMAGRIGVGAVGVDAITRVYGESLRRIVEMNADLYHTHVEVPMRASGLDEAQMRAIAVQASAELVPAAEALLMALYRRHDERQITQHLVEHIESEMLDAGLIEPRTTSPAMCFVDLSGYTRLTEELGDRAAAELAGRLAGAAQSVSTRHGGHPVKWLGDGVMLHFREPAGGVLAALEMVDEGPRLGLPQAHAGVSTGPIVQQDGDYFGRTVNLAARIAGHAGPGQVLVSQEVVDDAPAGPLSFDPIGAVELRGFLEPVHLHLATRT